MRIPVPFLIPQPKSIRMAPKGGVYDFTYTHGECDEEGCDHPEELIRVDRDETLPPEAYRIRVTPGNIQFSASTERGIQYACITFEQLVMQYHDPETGLVYLPCMEIDDAPDFAHRGFMLDVSRGRVPRMETLLRLVDLLALLKYNQLQLYIEHTFAFKRHPLLGRGHSPFTAAEIRKLDAYCREYDIELVPNLQSFGHAAHTLKHRRYAHLAESDYRGGWTLSPVESGTYGLLKELYAEFLPSFSHRPFFNVGCDETWDLGRGKSKPLAEKIGLGRVYLGHLLKVHKLVKRHKMRMMFWGDIIEKYPDLMPEIPKDVIVLNWEYEAGANGKEAKRYRGRLEPTRKSGLEHWVCPGTSSWNSFFFRKTNARINMREFAKAGLAAGATGYLLTNWGDNGHYNFLSHSLWPIAYGADCAWRAKPDPKAEALFDERFVYLALGDTKREFLEPLRLLGELYRDFGVEIRNTSPERMFLTGKPSLRPERLGVVKEIGEYSKITRKSIEKTLRNAGRAAKLLEKIDAESPDIEQIRREWLLGARLAAHACRRALWHNFGAGDRLLLRREIRALASEFEQLWLKSDRESDLSLIRDEFKQIEKGYSKRKPDPIRF